MLNRFVVTEKRVRAYDISVSRDNNSCVTCNVRVAILEQGAHRDVPLHRAGGGAPEDLSRIFWILVGFFS